MEGSPIKKSRHSSKKSLEPIGYKFMSQYKRENWKPEAITEDGKTKLYHLYHSQLEHAEIPDFQDGVCEDEDREESAFPEIPPHIQYNQKIIDMMMEVSELPLETVLKIWAFCSFDACMTLEAFKNFKVPQLVPDHAKALLTTHMLSVRTRRTELKKVESVSKFHFAEMLGSSVDSKMLVKTYYDTKKKLGGDVSLIKEETIDEYPGEHCQEVQNAMDKAQISFVKDTRRKKRGARRESVESDVSLISSKKSRSSMENCFPTPEKEPWKPSLQLLKPSMQALDPYFEIIPF